MVPDYYVFGLINIFFAYYTQKMTVPLWCISVPISLRFLRLNNLIVSSLLPEARMPLFDTARVFTQPVCEWSVKLVSRL